jgi:hypothetical protein
MYREQAKLTEQERGIRADQARADLPWYMQRNLGAVLARWLRGRRRQ